MMPSEDLAAEDRALRLVRLFSADPREFGSVSEVAAVDVPEPYRTLLDHHRHMTVAMERFHGGPVTLRVVARTPPGADGGYAREILLSTPDGRVVQYGIVRINLAALPPSAAARVREESAPLGRVLIDAGVLCDIQGVRLLQILPGPHLASLLGTGATYGRVARIAVGGHDTLELLEIAAAQAGA